MWGTCFRFFPWIGVSSLAFWVLMGLVVLFLLMRLYRSNGSSRPREFPDHRDSLEILKMRLAKGEIDREEYIKIREFLGN